MYIIKLISGPTLFYSTVMKLYLRLKLTEEPTLYNAVKYAEPARIDKLILLL